MRPGGERPALTLYTALYMTSTRTQIYLTQEQRLRLDDLAERRGQTLAQLVREAVDAYLAETAPDAQGTLEKTFGSMPDLKVPSREEWDRDNAPRRH
jgi:hypothetical protein